IQAAAAEKSDILYDTLKPCDLPEVGQGARLAPLKLDMDVAGAVALIPMDGKVIDAESADLLGTTMESLLYAHYRGMLASEMQVASTEQSYADLEAQNLELRQAYQRLQTLDRLKSDFVANVNHELRTPLTAILGFTELLQLDEEDFNEDQNESIEQIHRKATHLLKLVSKVLVFTETNDERPNLKFSEFDPRELLKSVIEYHKPYAAERGIKIRTAGFDADITTMEADRKKIEAVLDGLIDNAVKFSPDGSAVTVMIEATQDSSVVDNAFLAMAESGPSEILIHVTDQGPGFTKEQMKEIFTDFHQLDTSSTREHDGLGLGLALAKRVVEQHTGRVMVDSAPGEGAHFVISLPIKPPPELRQAPKKKILIAEQSDFIFELIGGFLRDQGYEVISAVDGADARRIVLSQPIDLLIMDLRLPDQEGIVFLEELRREQMARSLPIVVATGVDDEDIHDRAFDAGVLDVLVKPFTREILLECIREPLQTEWDEG
ncbi:MAG: response regulator, partial [Chrysiogenetes bacterium]|nr:response regulator [Chrysiogenetes bacterium]